MKRIKCLLIGGGALLVAFAMNFGHALNDYGVAKNKLSVEVLAQSNNGGGSSSGGSGGSGGSQTLVEEKLGPSCNISIVCQEDGEPISCTGDDYCDSYKIGEKPFRVACDGNSTFCCSGDCEY